MALIYHSFPGTPLPPYLRLRMCADLVGTRPADHQDYRYPLRIETREYLLSSLAA